MTETSGPDTPPTADRATIRCQQCGQEVPALTTCVRCGDPLGPELRKGRSGRVREEYAAAPEEKARALRLISTLYPALPREEIRTFQTALLAGTALVVVLGVLGFFPVAIVAAAVLVPLITVIYLYDVDTYEDEPVRVVALTFLWGALAGAVFSFLLDQVLPVQAAGSIGGSAVGEGGGPGIDWLRGAVAPLVAGLLMALGPLAMLGQRRFNDVLDGATFGVTSAVAFVGAQTIVTSISLFKSGLQPGGDILPWVVRLIGLGVATPIIAAGAIGGVLGVVWLRHRGPEQHEDMLGPLGNPVIATLLAGALLLANALVQTLLVQEDVVTQIVELVALAVIAIVALLWLRRIIHLGLLQESLEIEVGQDILCANCHKPTPRHSFCGECGVSLRALPKDRRRPAVGVTAGVAAASAVAGDVAAPHEVRPTEPPAMPPGAAGAAVAAAGGPALGVPTPSFRSWLGPRGLLIVFGVVLTAVTVVALVVAFVISQGLDKPVCPEPDLPCAAAILTPVRSTSGTPADVPFPPLTRYTDDATGFSFDYDGAVWEVSQQNTGFVLLSAFNGAVGYIVEAAPVDRMDMQRLFDARRELLSRNVLGFSADTDPAHALIGRPLLGHRAGLGGLFGGTIDSPQGPSTDFAIAEVASTDGTIVAVATILVPAEARPFGLQLADSINNTFRWPTDPVVQ